MTSETLGLNINGFSTFSNYETIKKVYLPHQIRIVDPPDAFSLFQMNYQQPILN
jgi:hypothetical protein